MWTSINVILHGDAQPWYSDWAIPIVTAVVPALVALIGVLVNARRTADMLIAAEGTRNDNDRAAELDRRDAERRQFLRGEVAELAAAARERSKGAEMTAAHLAVNGYAPVPEEQSERHRTAVDRLAAAIDRIRLTISDPEIESCVDGVWEAHVELQKALGISFDGLRKRGSVSREDLQPLFDASDALDAATDDLVATSRAALAEPVIKVPSE
ncbi:hypothetical protein [Cellulomonas sp. P5_E12]